MGAVLNHRGTIQERMASRHSRDDNTGCWNWTGALSAGKYGSIYYEGRMQKAHRVMWILTNGPVPTGLDLDHLCRNMKCINPAHLEPVTRAENLRRSPIMTNQNEGKTHCIRGHEFTPENTRFKPGSGHRVCKTCMRMHIRNWRARNADAIAS